MDACERPGADARARAPSRRTRRGSRCLPPLAGVVLAMASPKLRPRSVEHAFWYHEVPRLHEPPCVTLPVEVARLSRDTLAKSLQVLLFDEEGFPVLIQEEAHA